MDTLLSLALLRNIETFKKVNEAIEIMGVNREDKNRPKKNPVDNSNDLIFVLLTKINTLYVIRATTPPRNNEK